MKAFCSEQLLSSDIHIPADISNGVVAPVEVTQEAKLVPASLERWERRTHVCQMEKDKTETDRAAKLILSFYERGRRLQPVESRRPQYLHQSNIACW